MQHELKVWADFFPALIDGSKNFEIRKDDRGFRVGDTLLLREYLPKAKRHTGREVVKKVTYILSGPMWGITENFVIMSLA